MLTDEDRIVLSAYREIASISSHKNITLVQNTCTGRIFVKKVLTVYNRNIYDCLMSYPVKNMPVIYDIFEDNGTLTVIEEYISGKTLEEIADEKGLFSEQKTASIGIEICRILTELHSTEPPIIHRDIKPSNIILSSDGIVKLLDINAARLYSEDTSSDTKLIGTAGFAAPEQYGFGQSSPRTDIYEVGALMSVLCYGGFPGEVYLTGKLGEIIKKCTDMKPESRYSSAKQLEHALSSFLYLRNRTSFVTANSTILRYLPPGFRSLDPGHMIAACFIYYIAFGATFLLQVDGVTGIKLFFVRFFTALGVVICSLFTCNWLEIQENLPLANSRNPFVRFLAVIIYDTVFILFMLIFSIFIVSR